MTTLSTPPVILDDASYVLFALNMQIHKINDTMKDIDRDPGVAECWNAQQRQELQDELEQVKRIAKTLQGRREKLASILK